MSGFGASSCQLACTSTTDTSASFPTKSFSCECIKSLTRPGKVHKIYDKKTARLGIVRASKMACTFRFIRSVPFRCLLLCFVPLRCTLFCSVPVNSVSFYSTPIYPVLFPPSPPCPAVLTHEVKREQKEFCKTN